MAVEFGWTLSYIRSLSPRDFHIMSMCMNIKSRVDVQIKKMEATKGAMAGATPFT